MKKLNNNPKLLDKLNAQFAEELGFDVMLRKTTNYLMEVIGMRGQCAISKDNLQGVYEMINEKLGIEDVELVLEYFVENDCIRIEEMNNCQIITLTEKMKRLQKQLQEQGGGSYRELSCNI